MSAFALLAFDLGAEIYDWFTDQSTWRASCARLAEGLPVGGRVLDLGCGPGVSTFTLARLRPDLRLVGLDLAPRMLRRAWRRRARLRLERRVALVRADAARLPFASGSLDGVVGHSVLYLVPRRERVLAEVARVLRPGGLVAFMEPSAVAPPPGAVLRQSRDPRFLISVALWRPFSALHGRFSPDTLALALRQAGLESLGGEPALGGLGVIGRARKPERG